MNEGKNYYDKEKKRIIIVGGDGFCGWPMSLRMSNLGHEVMIVDNMSRRRIDEELGTNSLTDIASIDERIATWKKVSDKTIKFQKIDVSKDFEDFCNVVKSFAPNAIIHLGEQRAAPYSMKNSTTARYTVNNNLNVTHNILRAIVDIDRNIHLIHMGTMGVYGYGSVEDSIIEEGYVDVMMKNKEGEFKPVNILHPAFPGSVYHMTKAQDELFFQFYAKNYQLKITDLHQGIIWGLYTKETDLHPKLINRFDYDGDYGTVLNRFIMQSAHDVPLTVYGTGEQTRAFIHIENSMNCVELAINNPPIKGDRVKIFNQMTECHTLINLVALIKEMYPSTQVSFLDNPRRELVKNDLLVSNESFVELGLDVINLSGNELKRVYQYIKSKAHCINKDTIKPSSSWK